ncbi:MAG: sulfatase [Anaerolineae bacterium]
MKNYPDIVLLVLDTQRVDRLGCYGYDRPVSPCLDALAERSIRYTQAVSPAQWTLPAHASLLTGLYPSQHTVTQHNSVLPSGMLVLTERLHKAGYYNALLSNNPFVGAMNNGLRRGFDRVVNYSYIGSGLWTSNFQEVDESSSRWRRWRLQMRQRVARWLGLDTSHTSRCFGSAFTVTMEYLLRFRGGSKLYNTRRTLDQAADLLIHRRGVSTSHRPIFTLINLMGTHIPYAPPRWAAERFVSPEWKPKHIREYLHQANAVGLDIVNWIETNLPQSECQTLLGGFYDAEVFAQDAQIGYFLNRLQKAGVNDNLWLIVVADHGEYLGEKQRLNHIFGAYQPLAHVPLLIQGPGRKMQQERVVTSFVSTRRIFHTILDIVGLATAEDASLSLLQPDSNMDQESAVFCEAESPQWVTTRLARIAIEANVLEKSQRRVRAIYANDYKLISDQHTYEVYEVRRDPQERHDLSILDIKTTEQLTHMLQVFSDNVDAATEKRSFSTEEDPNVLQRLKDLGYWE